MRITKNYVECRDPIAHRSNCIVRSSINREETAHWEKSYGLIMKRNIYLVFVWVKPKDELRGYRICEKDFKTLKEMGII